jgi:hypothetical protein
MGLRFKLGGEPLGSTALVQRHSRKASCKVMYSYIREHGRMTLQHSSAACPPQVAGECCLWDRCLTFPAFRMRVRLRRPRGTLFRMIPKCGNGRDCGPEILAGCGLWERICREQSPSGRPLREVKIGTCWTAMSPKDSHPRSETRSQAPRNESGVNMSYRCVLPALAIVIASIACGSSDEERIATALASTRQAESASST